jgi:hypothetical protein
MSIDASVISLNSSLGSGGGIGNLGTLTVTDSALLDNWSDGEGDALYSQVGSENATSITGSCIVGNGDTAVFNSQPASQNASGNWWGDASGPTHPSNPGGTGDSVGDNVDFSLWLLEAPGVCAP